MRLPDRRDFLDYAESAGGQDAEVQKRILSMLATSTVVREQLAELKKDLHIVASQVPDYGPDASLGPELVRLSQSWVQVIYTRKFSLKDFHRSSEFFGLILAIMGLALLLIGLLGFQLLRHR
jgi:hypothetical protein